MDVCYEIYCYYCDAERCFGVLQRTNITCLFISSNLCLIINSLEVITSHFYQTSVGCNTSNHSELIDSSFLREIDVTCQQLITICSPVVTYTISIFIGNIWKHILDMYYFQSIGELVYLSRSQYKVQRCVYYILWLFAKRHMFIRFRLV